LNPGIAKAAVDQNKPIEGTNCHGKDIAYSPLQNGNTFGDTYRINFTHPCAQDYLDSFARLLVSWGVDFLKLDAVSPGSGRTDIDNRPDVKSWSEALKKAGSIYFMISWNIDVQYASYWKQYANGWRVDDDVECYCNTLVSWNSVHRMFSKVQPWVQYAGPGGWNDLDSLDIGYGPISGLSDAERQSYVTLWTISCAPLYTGNDLNHLDAYGISLLTNPEVILVDQQGRPASPTPSTKLSNQQVWFAKNTDASYTVALFNLGAGSASVRVNWSDLGFSGSASVRDLWKLGNLGNFTGSYESTLVEHGSMLLKVSPTGNDVHHVLAE